MKYSFSTAGQSEEFRSALRRFEQGLFEKAGQQLMDVLKTEPDNADAVRLLRLIERRLWPRASAPATLIWQFRPHTAWETDWLHMLLGDHVAREVVDNSWSHLAETMIVVDSRLVPEKVPYYQRAFENGCKIILVHLSDEAFNDDLTAYRFCEGVIRNYRSDVLAECTRLFFLPLGYKTGFAKPDRVPKPATERRHLWSFAGDPNKLTRAAMVNAMREAGPGFEHFTSGFDSADCLPTDDYRALFDETVFVPCPSGWSNLETFRVYEALEAGAIPIVERRKGFDYYTALLGPHPIPGVLEWSETPAFIRGMSLSDRETLRVRCHAWWMDAKQRLATEIGSFMKNALVSA